MKYRILIFLAAVICFAAVVHSQEPSQPSPGPTVGGSSSVDNQGIKNYLLGPGDVLDIRFFGQPELNTLAEVDSDGNISSLPFLEAPIPAKCRTEKEIQKDISAAYAKYIKGPQVSVRITERKSHQPAAVFGAVRQPTRLQMQRKVRLNEIVAASGGFTERAAGTIQILHTEPLMCPGPGEEAAAAPIDGTTIPMDLVKIEDLKSGKADANPFIRPGDYINVLEADPVYITGSVVSPQNVYMRDKLTLSTALAMVGGVRKEAKSTEVRIYRVKPGEPDRETIKVDLAAIKKNQKSDFLLQAFDVIEVPEAGIFSGQRIGTTLMTSLTGGLNNVMGSAPLKILY